MLSLVWRLSLAAGTSLAVLDRIISLLPEPPTVVRREGAFNPCGRGKNDKSGFNYSVSEGPEMDDVLCDLGRFLDSLDLVWTELETLTSSDTELDFGFDVGVDKHFTRTVRFPPKTLERLASRNIMLAVSGYPWRAE